MTAQTILPANTLSGGYEVANSLRFDKPSDSYLEKTFSSAGSTRKFTFSTWLKGHDTAVHGSTYFFVGNINGSSNIDAIGITDSGIQISVNSANSGSLNSTALFRDLNAWYHFVIGVDTTQSTASNRVKVYINGVQVTAWDTETYPSQNYDFTGINSTEVHNVSYSDSEHNGYLCETVFIDGTQYAASDFGEFDEDSSTIWKPKKVSDLTFGQNGFYLEYKGVSTGQNSNGLGADTSGNDHHFASSGLAAIDQSTDTCTNNFATINPLYVGLNANFGVSEGNLKGLNSGDGENNYVSNFGVSSGKWYFEAKANVAGNDIATIGIVATDSVLQTNGSWLGSTSDSYFYNENGGIGTNGSASTTGLATYADNNIIGVRVNLDDNELHFYKNGTIITNTALSITANKEYFFGGRVYTNATGWEFNFGSPAYAISSGNADANGYGNFEYSVPSGYYALNSKNLAEFG